MGFEISKLGFDVSGLGFEVSGLGFEVSDQNFGTQPPLFLAAGRRGCGRFARVGAYDPLLVVDEERTATAS